MRVLLSTLQYLGHVVPAAVFKHALEQRGHFVHWEICAVDAPSGPLETHLRTYAKDSPNQHRRISRILNSGSFDCLVTDPPIVAAWDIRRETGIPWAIFGNLPIFYVDERVPLYLQCSVPEFEPNVRRENVKFIGPMVPSGLIEKGKTPDWIGMDAPVHVTQGTLATDPEFLIRPTIRALSGDYRYPWLVTEPFPHCHWMKYLKVFVTNGGFSGVSQALFNGVPMVLAGTTEDKAIVAERIEAMGCGINLRCDIPSPKMLRDAIFHCLKDEKIKLRCKEIAKKCQFFSPDQGVDHLEHLVFSRYSEMRA